MPFRKQVNPQKEILRKVSCAETANAGALRIFWGKSRDEPETAEGLSGVFPQPQRIKSGHKNKSSL